MTRARPFATVAALLLAALPASADPLSDLTRGGEDACFRRVYDETHLRQNPRQQVTSMTVWIAGKPDAMPNGNMGLSMTRRSDATPLFLSGDCAWSRFDKPPQWMRSFTKRAGAGCVTSAVPDVFPGVSSAEEGGAVLLDPAADGRSMMVHLDDGQVMVTRARRAAKIPLTFGRDDRVFRLQRAEPSACASVKDAVTTPEPK